MTEQKPSAKISIDEEYKKVFLALMDYCQGSPTAMGTVYVSAEIPNTLYERAVYLKQNS